MIFITLTVNEDVYIEILDDFLISSIENSFSGDDVIFRMIMRLVTTKEIFEKTK